MALVVRRQDQAWPAAYRVVAFAGSLVAADVRYRTVERPADPARTQGDPTESPRYPPDRARRTLGGMRILRRRWVQVVGVGVLLLLVAADLFVFVWPPSDFPRRTDLVVVLGPWQQLSRPATGATLVRRYPETPLLISVYDLGECPRLQQVTGDPKAVCFLPNPFTTRGEARGAAAYARKHGLRSMTVVTTADQLVRAGVRFARCADGPVQLAEAASSLRFRLVRLAYQNAAMLKALLWERTC